MARLTKIATVLAVLAAVVALVALLRSDKPAPEPVSELAPDADRAPKKAKGLEARHVHGGVFSGHVTDLDGTALHGARVLLVSYTTGAADLTTAGQGADDQPIAHVGKMKVAGEGITDERGAFRIAAGSHSLVTRVLAYHKGYFLDVLEVDHPQEGLVLRLPAAGRVIGTVVDDVTGEPVSHAVVDIYLQQKVASMPEGAEKGGYVPFKREQYDMSWLVTLGKFISSELGKRIWDVVDSGSETLRMMTDKNGRFEFGPIADTVQLEFVITHAAYKWYDFDTDEGKHTPNRTVVAPGDTVERTFRLRKGLHISGQVVDETDQPLADVGVKVQSISAYARHWWYRFKWRHTRTDKQGRFRVEGLARGSQEVIFTHPAFGTKTMSVKGGTEDLMVVADSFGAVQGSVDGVGPGKEGRKILVLLESTAENPATERRMRRTVDLSSKNTFVVQRVLPGEYRIWIRAGKQSSEPQVVRIDSLKTAALRFEVGLGGSITLRVVDETGGLVDPTSARLVHLGSEGERAMGSFVSREGVYDIDGIAPGTYRLEVGAPGRITTPSESFVVERDRTTRLAPLVIQTWAFLKFGQPVDENGDWAKIRGELVLEFRQGKAPFQRIYNAGIAMPVRPGTYEIRARTDDLAFQGSVEAVAGQTQEVAIVLAPGR